MDARKGTYPFLLEGTFSVLDAWSKWKQVGELALRKMSTFGTILGFLEGVERSNVKP